MKLDKNSPDYYKIIAGMRKTLSGGKYFKNTEGARAAQTKSVQARLRNARQRPKATKTENIKD